MIDAAPTTLNMLNAVCNPIASDTSPTTTGAMAAPHPSISITSPVTKPALSE